MLVLTIRLPKDKIETETPDAKSWLKKAGTTLAEAARKAAVLILDVEFDEIRSGFRFRSSDDINWIDIYLYDSLSSGAGYCAQVGKNTEELLKKTREVLIDCNCDSACNQCLKHYRNQYLQSSLDRFAALELLEYGKSEALPPVLSQEDAYELIKPLSRLISGYGIAVRLTEEGVIMSIDNEERKCAVYPAMVKVPDTYRSKDFITISKEALKKAKPYALKQITLSFT